MHLCYAATCQTSTGYSLCASHFTNLIGHCRIKFVNPRLSGYKPSNRGLKCPGRFHPATVPQTRTAAAPISIPVLYIPGTGIPVTYPYPTSNNNLLRDCTCATKAKKPDTLPAPQEHRRPPRSQAFTLYGDRHRLFGCRRRASCDDDRSCADQPSRVCTHCTSGGQPPISRFLSQRWR